MLPADTIALYDEHATAAVTTDGAARDRALGRVDVVSRWFPLGPCRFGPHVLLERRDLGRGTRYALDAGAAEHLDAVVDVGDADLEPPPQHGVTATLVLAEELGDVRWSFNWTAQADLDGLTASMGYVLAVGLPLSGDDTLMQMALAGALGDPTQSLDGAGAHAISLQMVQPIAGGWSIRFAGALGLTPDSRSLLRVDLQLAP